MYIEKIKILVYKSKIIEVKCIHVEYKTKLTSRHRDECDGKGLMFTYFFGITGWPPLNYNLIICLNVSRPLGE